ncbi:MAG TPA: PSD1 and planctomycete cytochrome C domain-containing protein [Blastocatellia bacterium]|nr:PSD1 and planctomycete cytochrome C domain-containing protein [Blastocatellia bacterium]
MTRIDTGLNRLIKLTLAVAFVGGAVGWGLPAAAGRVDEGQEFFEKQVRPILVTKCQGCHNAKFKSAGLDISSAEGFLHGGESGPLLSQENPEESRLLKVIGYESSLKMPPTGKLKDEEIAVLAAWVKMGAPWPGAAPAAAAAPRSKPGAVREFSEAEKNFWAFQGMQRPAPPEVKDARWARSPVDRFILQKLEAKGLAPAPPADRLTLLRRATYDLTGLPPTEQEMKDFVADNSPDAFGRVVERLLGSPRYGERWGRHWLDVARYADSTGNDEDHRYPHAWKYRDYVIDAFNRDLPYDQFVREQLAGDLLPGSAGEEVNRRGIIATGFLALGPKAIAQQDKKKMLYDVYDEQVDVTSKAFLGLTLACARCHDHKFDPLLAKDYYSMIAIFAGTRSFKDPDSHVSVVLEKPLVTAAEYDRYQAANRAHQEQVKRERIALDEILDAEKERVVRAEGPRLAEYLLAARRVYHDGAAAPGVARQAGLDEGHLAKWVEYLKPGERVRQHLLAWDNARPEQLSEAARGYQERFRERLAEWDGKMVKWRAQYAQALAEQAKAVPERPRFDAGEDRFFSDVYLEGGGPYVVTEKDQARLGAGDQERVKALEEELARLKKSAPPEPEMACAVEDGEPVAQKVFIRGDYNSHGEDAPKGFPLILARESRPASEKGNGEKGSGRLELAAWLTRPEHPLTARVMANRIWQWHFGEGLVRTPDNFGKMGERPTHPELLDFLARRFVESGWSVKAMHRLIMLSSAYQMATENPGAGPEADPENRLLTRFPRRRLSVEEMRDGLLAIDGSLDLTVGGTLQQGRGTDGENSGGRLSLNPEKLKRRTVYVPLRRANLPTLLNLFDFGDATTVAGRRQLTNVATQALFWLNSRFLTESSLKVSEALVADKNLDDAGRVRAAYRRILNREATPEEVDAGLKFVAGARRGGWQSLCRALMSSNDFVYLD